MSSFPAFKKIFKIWKSSIEPGISVDDQVYNLPIILRRDGVDLKLGQVVTRKGCQSLSYIIREILLHGDLTHITLVLHPLEPCHDLNGTPQWKTSISSKSFESDVCVAKLMGELVVVELEDVIPDQERLICEDVARDGMRKVIAGMPSYPAAVHRTTRRHQLSVSIRNSCQLFLSGQLLSRSLSLGDVDWRHDPGILGLDRESQYSLEYRIEQFAGEEQVTSHLDVLLGDQWDIRKIGESSDNSGVGYRVIITLEIAIDMKQQLRLNTHAITCRGEVDTCNYRHVAVSHDRTRVSQLHVSAGPSIHESIHSARGVSLDWEEFQDSSKLCDATSDSLSIVLERYPTTNSDSEAEVNKSDSPEDIGKVVNADIGKVLEEDIEKTTGALFKLLNTPTKGFSQIVFNDSVNHNKNIHSESISEDEDLPSLSPIGHLKLNSSSSNVDIRSYGLSSLDLPGTRLSHSTPEKSIRIDAFEPSQVLANKVNIEPINDNSVSEDITEISSNNNNVIAADKKCDKNEFVDTRTLQSQSSASKVEAYVQNLPYLVKNSSVMVKNPSRNDKNSEEWRLGEEERGHNRTILDESFDSETSSKSKLSSRQSDILSIGSRYNNSGMFLGSTLAGPQTVCPFPSDWQFQTVPESIENSSEID